jgi:hypothetical protein
MEFDETTDGLIPVDITNETIVFDLFREVQQTDGSFKSVLIVSERECNVIDADEGWVNYEIKENEVATFGMYFMNIRRSGTSTSRTYPSYQEQWIRVLPLTTPPMEFTPEEL